VHVESYLEILEAKSKADRMNMLLGTYKWTKGLTFLLSLRDCIALYPNTITLRVSVGFTIQNSLFDKRDIISSSIASTNGLNQGKCERFIDIDAH
jgi:hypothetical protein